MTTAAPERTRRVTAVLREEARVTPLELFFDLVFVLALTQCTALMAATPTWEGLGQGLLVLGLMWWAWTGYAWLTSVIEPEEGVVRIVIFAAMAGSWWSLCAYRRFDVVALVAERRLSRAAVGHEQNSIARDSYSFLHLPMVAGIILLALGMKKTLGDVGDPLKLVPATAMLGGTALYLLAHVAFRWRNLHTLNKQRLVCAILLVALLPLAVELAALALVGILAAVLSALILYETRRFAEPRARIRQQLAHQAASE